MMRRELTRGGGWLLDTEPERVMLVFADDDGRLVGTVDLTSAEASELGHRLAEAAEREHGDDVERKRLAAGAASVDPDAAHERPASWESATIPSARHVSGRAANDGDPPHEHDAMEEHADDAWDDASITVDRRAGADGR